MEKLVRDLRYALRSLARTPGFTLGVVLTLALGIGANATMFGVVDTLFLKPPAGVTDPGRVERIYIRRRFNSDENTGGVGKYPVFQDLRAGGAFAQTAAVTGRTMSLGRGAQAEEIQAGVVSHDFFPLVGVTPARGRFFTAAEDNPAGERVAVLSWGFWQRHFAGDTSVLGKPLAIGKGTYTVIGIAPKDFGGIDIKPVDLWLPIEIAASEVAGTEALTSRGWWWMTAIGRLKPGATVAQTEAYATQVLRRGAVAAKDNSDTSATIVLGPIQAARSPRLSDTTKVSIWVGGVSLLVLLIACANVANLLLARGATRRRELAVRAGLGAGRAGLMQLLFAESLVLALSGGAAAVLIAAWGGAAARGILIPELPAGAATVDGRLLAFTLVVALSTTLLIGILPALSGGTADVAEALKSGSHATQRGSRTRLTLVAAQVALTLVLLVGAGLFVRSLRNVENQDMGFDIDKVFQVAVNLDAAGMPKQENNSTYLALLDRIQRLPGVAYAAATMGTPFSWAYASYVRAEGADSIPSGKGGGPYFVEVTPDYFKTMGTRIVSGREFNAGDVFGAGRVAIVSASFVRTVWPGKNAIGKCLFLGGDSSNVCTQVVGVTADSKRGSVLDTSLQYYVPLAQDTSPHISALMVRARGATAPVADAIRHEIQNYGSLPYAQIQTLSEQIDPQLESWRLGSAAFSAFGLLALLIASMGIFAVISYSVSQRTQEIGIRMALGAESRRVAQMIVGQGVRPAIAGVLVGAAGAVAMGRTLRSLLYGVGPNDPAVFIGVAVILLAVAALAAWLPARRAARVNPVVALRYE